MHGRWHGKWEIRIEDAPPPHGDVTASIYKDGSLVASGRGCDEAEAILQAARQLDRLSS